MPFKYSNHSNNPTLLVLDTIEDKLAKFPNECPTDDDRILSFLIRVTRFALANEPDGSVEQLRWIGKKERTTYQHGIDNDTHTSDRIDERLDAELNSQYRCRESRKPSIFEEKLPLRDLETLSQLRSVSKRYLGLQRRCL
ncbi:hypothetical protein Trydic_g23456 [Trypoxylus dichotomus]